MSITDKAPSSAAAAPAFCDADRAALDAMVEQLHDGERAWAMLDLGARAALLMRVHESVAAHAKEWADTAISIKGLDPGSPLAGEEWISGAYPVLTSLALLAHSLRNLAAGKSPLAGTKFGTASGGRVTVKVLPHNRFEALLLHGFTAEVWMPPGMAAGTVSAQAGLAGLHPTVTDGVGLVLGAGNITSIPPLDVLYELVANNRVVLLKLNPVMARMAEVYRKALAPLIEAGLLTVVQGGAQAGGYLAHHPGISHVHITGSAATHDAIVWGSGAQANERKAGRTPLLGKPITSELGGVSPVIMVPGRWTKRDLRFQAEHVATMRLHNGGYNCIAGQVVVLSSDWQQKDAFLAELRSALHRAPHRPAWYPGSDERVASAIGSYPQAERCGLHGERLLIDVSSGPSVMESTEYFSPVLGVIELPGTGKTFLDTAVATVNRDFRGTLGANVIAAPKDIEAMGAGFHDAIAALEYGTIGINAWTAVGFLTAAAPWGAFPGHTLGDVQSGIGTVHNALLISNPERCVVTGPFRPFPRSFLHGEFTLFPKPPWFVSARSAQATGRRLSAFAAKPGWLRMPAVFAAAFRA